jgi:hypothetical protein
MTPTNDPAFGELVRLNELRTDADIARLFPGEHSLTWEIRQHRAEYVAGGALFVVAGRLLVHPAAFKRIALAIGARAVADQKSTT